MSKYIYLDESEKTTYTELDNMAVALMKKIKAGTSLVWAGQEIKSIKDLAFGYNDAGMLSWDGLKGIMVRCKTCEELIEIEQYRCRSVVS